MSKIKYADNGGKKKSPFFAIVLKGSTLIASQSSPRRIVERLKKNARRREKVFTACSN